ncbi:hypothetical protein MRB53_037099 [Persea americana]|nr:hypothetical protein MRB53_037099 [Persea americana]
MEESFGRGARERTRVKYDDGLTEEQWLEAVDNDDDTIEAAIARKEARKARRSKKLGGNDEDEGTPAASRASSESPQPRQAGPQTQRIVHAPAAPPARKRGRGNAVPGDPFHQALAQRFNVRSTTYMISSSSWKSLLQRPTTTYLDRWWTLSPGLAAESPISRLLHDHTAADQPSSRSRRRSTRRNMTAWMPLPPTSSSCATTAAPIMRTGACSMQTPARLRYAILLSPNCNKPLTSQQEECTRLLRIASQDPELGKAGFGGVSNGSGNGAEGGMKLKLNFGGVNGAKKEPDDDTADISD